MVRRLALQATYSVDCDSLSHRVTRATLTSIIRQHYDEVDSVCHKGTVNMRYLNAEFWRLPKKTFLISQEGILVFSFDPYTKSAQFNSSEMLRHLLTCIFIGYYHRHTITLLLLYAYGYYIFIRELCFIWKGECNSFHVLIIHNH